MTNTGYVLAGIAVMSGVTWAIRMIPLALIRRRFTNRFLLSFLYYLPYGVLAAMIFPAVFTACGSVPVSVLAATTAVLLSFFHAKLTFVAAVSVAVAWAAGLLIS